MRGFGLHLHLQISISLCLGSLHSTFKYFDILKSSEISVRVLRNENNKSGKQTRVSFKAFQIHFTMLLTPGTHVLHPEAEAKLVDQTGKETTFKIDRALFFSGTINNNPLHEVDAAKFDGIWIAHIHTPHEFYAVEPLGFYDQRANHKHMIVYKRNDIRNDNQTHGKPFCEEVSYDVAHSLFDRGKGPNIEADDSDSRPHLNKDHEDSYSGAVKSAEIFSKHRLKDFKGRRSREGDAHLYHLQGLKHQSLQKINKQPSQNTFQSRKKRCKHKKRGFIKPEPDRVKPVTFMDLSPILSKSYSKQRKKRYQKYSQRRTNCDILVIVDHTLFQGLGRKSETRVITTLLQIYRLVDRTFRKTTFDNGYIGYGIVISAFRIHTEPSYLGYNTLDKSKPAKYLLDSMSMHEDFLDYCVVHLSVQRDFGINVGLAAVAKESGFQEGICGTGEHELHVAYAHNVGLSTITDFNGEIQTMKMYSLVVAHEIGHNWGAHHDPENFPNHPCSPSTEDGGKFLMWPYIASGKDSNSDKFSPCSIGDISKILKKRAHKCFLSNRNLAELCGNGLVEPAEECDPGFEGMREDDACCSKQCRFKSEAVCSPRNDPCCTKDCKIAGVTHKCHPRGGMQECYRESYCLGNSSWECPLPLALPNKTPCGDKGWCWHGRCMSFCEKLGLSKDPPRDYRPCQCEQNRAAMCQHCCVDTNISVVGKTKNAFKKCVIMGGRIKEGSPCVKGKCSNGVCRPYRYRDNATLVRYFLPEDGLDPAKAKDDSDPAKAKDDSDPAKAAHLSAVLSTVMLVGSLMATWLL